MSSEEQGLLAEIGRKLDVLVALTAAAGKEPDDQIKVLTSLGQASSHRLWASLRTRLQREYRAKKRP